jgi:hypothetical protein
MKAIVPVLVVSTTFAQKTDKCTQIRFEGELSSGQKFRREIGNGLSFRIDPWEGNSGWEFEIGPGSPAPNEWDQYAYVLTPPYRNSNAQQVNTGWGVMAQDAVRKPRHFQFLISRADAPKARAAIEQVLWPKSEQQQQTALQELGQLQHGSGDFRILDSKITPGTPVPGYSNCEDGHCGEIHWIRIQVTLVVPRSFTPARGLQIAGARCPGSSE